MMRRSTLALTRALVLAGCLAPLAPGAQAQTLQPPPLLPDPVVRALAAEVSGTEAKRTAQDLTLFHRMRGSRGFRAAAERVRDRLRQYGLADVQILELPADGTIFYGTQRSRPAWDADFAELWEEERAGDAWVDARRIASYDTRPVTLAEDSAGGAVTAELVDVGAGASEQDYAGKDVRGKLVLISTQPGAAASLAERLGVAGIVSYAQNQETAWWKEDETLVRWGHLPTFPAPKTFAFMVSLRQARDWQERLARGQAVRLRAEVKAGQHPGSYDVVTAVIPGADPALEGEEIVLSCHLDHLRPGANDNASGCAAILEVARTLSKLLREKEIPAPRRTIRFVWPPEMEGTTALLNARPEIARRARAVIHLDMVGGDASITKAVFHVTRSPKSLPTFVNDVGEALGRFVNEQTTRFADTGSAPYPLVDPEGSKQALQAAFVDYTEGSDHDVWSEGSFRVPAIYMNDWPDRYIHTDGDEIGNLDPTKLLRAAFLGAASAWYLADLDAADVPALWQVMRRHALERTAEALARRDRLRTAGQPEEGENVLRFHWAWERAAVDSLRAFAQLPPEVANDAASFLAGLQQLAGSGGPAPAAAHPDADVVYVRSAEPKGAMSGFGYNYFDDKRQALGLPEPALAGWNGLWGNGDLYLYEALNLVDGKRTVRQIRDDLAAIYGPVPIEQVAEFLDEMRRIGVVGRR
ncbi:MAG TPA: M28 family peptidase [Thermoanaerobaculia bacterium]|nr:M28 family peptidase [Thermoanaerobaculia bacterium]